MVRHFNKKSRQDFENWIKNIKNGMDKYFWDEAIYSLDKTYWSFEPFMRLCVDLRIEGYKPEEIAKLTGKKVEIVYQTLWRAKERISKAAIEVFNC